MADETTPNQPQEPEKPKEPQSDKDALFKHMSSVEPPLTPEVPSDDIQPDSSDGHASLEERMDKARKQTDMQVVDARLFPDLGHKHLNVVQVSRTFPDVYNPLFRILVKGLIRKSICSPTKDKEGLPLRRLSVDEAIAYVNTALSISIDGEGRIDEIHVFGRAAETEDTKAKNNLGLT